MGGLFSDREVDRLRQIVRPPSQLWKIVGKLLGRGGGEGGWG